MGIFYFYSKTKMHSVDLSRVHNFYHKYINLVSEPTLEMAFISHCSDLVSLLHSLTPAQWEYRYAEGKWIIKDVIQHLIDAERIFNYRALRFSRNDTTELPGFDENHYASAAQAQQRSSHDLIEELQTVRRSSAQLFGSFNDQQLEASGISNGNSIYVKAIGFIVVGHSLHHRNILLERYLP